MKTLIVNADDLGFVPSVTRGIVEAMEHGIVRSASLMVNTGHADHAVAAIRRLVDLGRDVGVGLHFNMVVGEPLLAARALTDSRGRFLPLTAHVARAAIGRLDLAAVNAELHAQLDRAEALLAPAGLSVTHIDSHRHTHVLPGVYDRVVAVARARGIPHVRHPVESGPTLLGRPHAILATRVLRALVGRNAPFDDARFGGVALMRSPAFDADLRAFLGSLPAGRTELMVHPGYDSPELAALDSYRAPRERELRALTSPEARATVEAAGIALAHFGATAPAASAATPAAPAGS